MRASISFKLEINMPHWSEDAKKREDQARDSAAFAEEVRLKDDRIIRAALPDFWQRLGECVKADAKAIQANFLHDLKCRCRTTIAGNTLTIQRMTHPFRMVKATCNPDAHKIDIALSPDVDALGSPENTDRQTIYASVLGDDLQFLWSATRCKRRLISARNCFHLSAKKTSGKRFFS
jgi:hypothetical protein